MILFKLFLLGHPVCVLFVLAVQNNFPYNIDQRLQCLRRRDRGSFSVKCVEFVIDFQQAIILQTRTAVTEIAFPIISEITFSTLLFCFGSRLLLLK